MTVKISVEDKGVHPLWRFVIEDTGIGMDPDLIPNLFQAFSQADETTTRRFGGTGLGLAICRRLVLAMNGDIGAMSEAGHGSTFWFKLPMAIGRADAVLRQNAASAYAPSDKCLNILVADDIAVNRLLITSILKKMGHEVYCVENGQLAVDAVTSAAFDLVLMDMQMPVMDGPAATKAIRSLEAPISDIPIYALTADALMLRGGSYLEIGLQGVLTKPIDASQLRKVLDDIGNNLPRSEHVLQQAPEPAIVTELKNLIFDERELESMREDLGTEVVDELLDLFVKDIDARCAALSAATETGDTAEFHRLAHSIKGAAAGMKAVGLESIARQLETASAAFDPASDELATAVMEMAAVTSNDARRRLASKGNGQTSH